MAKIKLNLDPDETLTFKRTVAIPTPDGTPLKIDFTYRHRTREQMADLAEAHAKRADETVSEFKPDDERPLREYITAGVKRDVSVVLDMITEWGLDGLELNAHNLGRFFALYAGAAKAISDDYRTSMMEGRLGN